GLGMMGFAEFAKVRSGGPAIAIGLGVALVASLTLAPALLQLLGKAVFWPCGVPAKQTGPAREDVWSRLSHLVARRPSLFWATAWPRSAVSRSRSAPPCLPASPNRCPPSAASRAGAA